MTFDFVAVPIFGKYIEPDKPTGFEVDPGDIVTLVRPAIEIPEAIPTVEPVFEIEGIPDNAPDIEPPRVIVPDVVIVPPVSVIPLTVPDVATEVTVPDPPPAIVRTLPPESTAKVATAVPGNADVLVYAGSDICLLCILQLATSASLLAFVPLNILSLF